jgi:pimeloyl-ACP methyl ester carboxylesterase
MRRAATLVVGCSLALLAFACAHPRPKDLAASTTFSLAREHGRYVDVGGLDLFEISLGAGRDLVLLHGNAASTYAWRKVIEPLAAHFHVHALDLPGFGFSDKPADAPYDPSWLASKVVAYMTALGIERAVMVGNSMGGHVASDVAILYPARVAALVLIDASGLRAEDGSVGEPPLAMRIATWPLVGALVRALPARSLVAGALRHAVYDPATVTDADVDAYYLPLRTPNGMLAFLRSKSHPLDPERDELVSAIRAPTLVITGDSDRMVPQSVAQRYHRLIAGSRLEVFEHTGHLPQEERPERTVEAITAFLAELQE